jgi:hypothetical protein
MPAGYELEYTTPLDWRVRRRVGLTAERGDVTRFVVQLEYRLDGEWTTVARFDHDAESEMGHDVTEEGLHLDVYRDGEKHRVEKDFPPVDLNRAINYCESYLEDNEQELIQRFELWHGVNDDTDR